MGIFGSFSKASKVLADAKKDVKRPKDRVAEQRSKNQKNGGKK